LRATRKPQVPCKSYLAEHSAGSGKSKTISWLSHRLSTLYDAHDERIFDQVIVITDRVENRGARPVEIAS